MKHKKILIIPLMILLVSCQGLASSAGSNTSESSDSSSSGSTYTDEDLNFKGITIDNEYIDYDSASFGGVLDDIGVGAWLVAGQDYTFSCSIKDLPSQEISVKFDDPSIIEYRFDNVDGQTSHHLIPLKTGGTTMKIYDSNDDLIYRNAVNCRVPIRDPKTMFELIDEADYWEGAFTSGAGYGSYKFFIENLEPNHVSISITGEDSGTIYGATVFGFDLDTYEESIVDTFVTYQFDCTIESTNPSLNILSFDVSLAVDTIYVSDNLGLIDFFRPVYL